MILTKFPLRQTFGLLESLFSLAKLNWNIPDISTLNRRLSKLKLILTKEKTSAMHLLVDSTGIKLSINEELAQLYHLLKMRNHGRGTIQETKCLRLFNFSVKVVGSAYQVIIKEAW